MSQLFNNYLKKNAHIPDNSTEFLHQEPEYKDVIVIGGTNDHVLQLIATKSDMQEVELSYKQGTEIILTKTFYMDLFKKVLTGEDSGNWIYPDNSTKLYILTDEELEEQYEHAKERGEIDVYQSVLTYVISPTESILFNDYNKDLTVQAKILYTDGDIEFSDIYKLKPIATISPEEDN